jgi:hypothetical protein
MRRCEDGDEAGGTHGVWHSGNVVGAAKVASDATRCLTESRPVLSLGEYAIFMYSLTISMFFYARGVSTARTQPRRAGRTSSSDVCAVWTLTGGDMVKEAGKMRPTIASYECESVDVRSWEMRRRCAWSGDERHGNSGRRS